MCPRQDVKRLSPQVHSTGRIDSDLPTSLSKSPSTLIASIFNKNALCYNAKSTYTNAGSTNLIKEFSFTGMFAENVSAATLASASSKTLFWSSNSIHAMRVILYDTVPSGGYLLL